VIAPKPEAKAEKRRSRRAVAPSQRVGATGVRLVNSAASARATILELILIQEGFDSFGVPTYSLAETIQKSLLYQTSFGGLS